MAQKTIPLNVKNEIALFIQILENEKLPIEKIILFGSFAHGKPHKWSDIDLCVVSPKFKDPVRAMQYLITHRPGDEVPAIEPIGFNPRDFKEGGGLIDEIKKTGIEIKI
jgi:uncharacterized protein